MLCTLGPDEPESAEVPDAERLTAETTLGRPLVAGDFVTSREGCRDDLASTPRDVRPDEVLRSTTGRATPEQDPAARLTLIADRRADQARHPRQELRAARRPHRVVADVVLRALWPDQVEGTKIPRAEATTADPTVGPSHGLEIRVNVPSCGEDRHDDLPSPLGDVSANEVLWTPTEISTPEQYPAVSLFTPDVPTRCLADHAHVQ